jgi:hypothetical protein
MAPNRPGQNLATQAENPNHQQCRILRQSGTLIHRLPKPARFDQSGKQA